MLWQCLASYADSHDEQQASAVLGDQSRLHTGRQADLAYVLWAERWIGHLSQVLPFIVVWSGQNVVVRSSLHDIKLLRVHVHASVLPVLLVKGLQRSKTFGAKLAELAVGFECHADSASNVCIYELLLCTRNILVPGTHMVEPLVEWC